MSGSPLPERGFTAEKFQNGRWVENSSQAASESLVCKDFLPLPDPDRSSCCNTVYQSFSETVQQANEWLSRHEGYQVVACESLPCTVAGLQTYLPDSWPNTTHLRALRVWLRGPQHGESRQGTSRSLLSYRDFTPHLDRKNLFSRDYEDVNVLLFRLNEYLAHRSAPARVLSVQTLDTPMSGLVDMDVDTEKSNLTFSQHGYTRYCRSLRVFLVTQYHVRSQLDPGRRPQPALRRRTHGLHPKGQVRAVAQLQNVKYRLSHLCVYYDYDLPSCVGCDSGEETLLEVMERALRWCQSSRGHSVLNMQVLPAKTGRATIASTWLLESPGHNPNKFTCFVRLVYTTSEAAAGIESPVSSISTREHRENTNHETHSGRSTPVTYDLSTQVSVLSGASGSGVDTPPRRTLPPLRHKAHEGWDVDVLKSGKDSKDPSISVEEVTSLPGVISVASAARPLTSPLHGLHCKTFVPRLVSSGGACGREEWEPFSQTVGRLRAWLDASQGTLLTLHTHYIYASGSKGVEGLKTQWGRFLPGRGQVAVMQVVVEGGRSPTACPSTPPPTPTTCVLL
ncbi:uncharacterized protein [Panulirus ornatus]|uniref:uncharacterized protein n=1 Tax=Panulirus ornatus TaxID=150431 RepID=UPI003A87D983